VSIVGDRNYMGSKQHGFTLLELVVVITIISVLLVVALERFYKLMVDVERTSMEYNLGAMRSAIGMQVAAHFVAGDLQGLTKLTESNPMKLLAEKPSNYLGSVGSPDLEELEKGSWVYDEKSQTLIYLVRNHVYFESVLDHPKRARFKIFPVYSDTIKGDIKRKYISGLSLREMEPYEWLRPWE
jgi:prepilin-type N-terminal cleavage/methylation domain-containing protein